MRSVKAAALVFIFLAVIQSCKKSDPTPPPTPQVPGCSSNTAPVNNSFITATTVTLTWIAVSGATSYDVYLGTNSTPTTTVATNVTGISYIYSIPATSSSTKYYWYVVPKNASGSSTGCSSTISSFTYAVIQAPQPFGYYVIGYIPSYRTIADVPDVKFKMCNVVNYAFFAVNSSGTLSANNTAFAQQVVAKAHANNCKAILSINEAATGNFKNMAASPAGRTAFIADVMNNLRTYNFDGVDIDWEFPSTLDGTSVTFTALMKELADSCHRDAKYYLTAAITAGKYSGSYRDAITTEVFGYADWFNIMAYDDFTTDPLQLYRQHSDYTLANVCITYWRNKGMPILKTVLGMPAYGRPSGMTQSGTVLTYKGILGQGGSHLSDSAFVTAGGFTNYKIYYNGQPTAKKKAMLAQQQGNGIMLWENGQDALDDKSLLKAICDTIGRPY